jgi:hypothetical protein
MREAYLALKEANQHSVLEWGWAQLEATFQHEVQVYAAALAAAEAVTQGQEDAGSSAKEAERSVRPWPGLDFRHSATETLTSRFPILRNVSCYMVSAEHAT